MKTSNSNRVNMINTTTGFCDANSTATAGITGFAGVLTAIKGKVVLINSLNQIGEGTTKGVTLDTKVLRSAMTALALKCANATLAFANATHNNTLAALVNYSESKLNSLKKEDVDDVCEAIHDATNTNIAGATPFGVSAGDVTDLQTSIDLYRTASQNPRQALITRSQAKKQAEEMIRVVIDDFWVAQLDKMVNTLKLSNKEFCRGYKQAIEILDLGTSTAKVRGTVLDINDTPIKGVVFTIFETGTTTKVAEVKTDVKGKYAATKLAAGDFDFRWSMDGYETVTEENIHISAGKDLRRKIVMEKAVVREGDVPMMGGVVNIDTDGINANENTVIKIEVTGTALRFYAAPTMNGAPGAVFFDVQAGKTITKSAQEFATLIGVSDMNKYVNVQSIGAVMGHYKVTFTNLS